MKKLRIYADGASRGNPGPASYGVCIFDQEGNLLIADTVLNAVLRYQGPNGASPGAFIDQFVASGSGGLDKPIGILFGSDGLLYVSSGNTDEVLRYGPTKFYVVNDASTNQTFGYSVTGGSGATTTLTSANTAPRGVASDAAGTAVWVVDANRNVYKYNASGGLLGSWAVGSVNPSAQLEGIATNGTDIWIVDNKQDKVFKYAGAASRLSGSQNAASSFSLNSANSNGKGIVTDGTSLWVVNDGSPDKVYKYNMSGTLLGSWTIDSANSTPTGITINPNNVSDIWIVDSGTDKVYQYTNAAGRTSGSQNAAASFALAAGNSNPQDIADPPGFAASLIPEPKPETGITSPGRPVLAEAFALSSDLLALASGHHHWLNDGAARPSSFLDPTPAANSEFTTPGNQGEPNRLDLLTVLDQELGHILGSSHTDGGVMQDTLDAGLREAF